MLIELLFGLASEGALRARIWSLPSMVHLMLLQLPLGPKYFLANAALLRVFSVVNFEVEFQGPMFFESFFTLGALVDSVQTAAVNLKDQTSFRIAMIIWLEALSATKKSHIFLKSKINGGHVCSVKQPAKLFKNDNRTSERQAG